MSAPSSPEKPRKLLRWTDSSELEDLPREHSRRSTDDASEGPGSDSIGLSKREDWYGVKMQRLKNNVEQLRKDLRDKERDYIRLKNKYNVSKRRQVQQQEDLTKFTAEKLDLDSELEFLRLQLLEKSKESAKQVENGDLFENGGHVGKPENGGHLENGGFTAEDCGIHDVEESYFTDDSFLSRKYFNLHKETRKLLTYMLLSLAICFSLISLIVRSSFFSTIVVGFWSLGLSCLWFERKQLFRAFKLKYLKKIREMSVENSRLRMETSKLESRATELGEELANEKREHEDVVSKLKLVSDKLAEEKAKNEELVKLEKSTFEDLQGERVRRRRAEEQLEEVSVQVLLAREKDEVAECGDVCQELRNNLKLERESKEKLGRENERLIKEIVEMNMKQEKERLEQEGSEIPGRSKEITDKAEDSVTVVAKVQVDEKGDESSLKYCNKRTEEEDGIKQARNDDEETKTDKETNYNEDIKKFDIKESENIEHAKPVASINLKSSQTVEISSQTTNVDQNTSQNMASLNNCWLCAWNIPNETSLAMLFIIIACLVLALKVVLASNVYMFFVLMALAGCFTYYQVARNIEQSN